MSTNQSKVDFQHQSYEILIHPNSEDLPDFLRNYRTDMIARRRDDVVVIEVNSQF
ncbi:MAG: hypothetical protein AAGA80_08555 [Cyanobacteria bacterium P01_F01_bin.143]